jgi:hypothetical protein
LFFMVHLRFGDGRRQTGGLGSNGVPTVHINCRRAYSQRIRVLGFVWCQ